MTPRCRARAGPRIPRTPDLAQVPQRPQTTVRGRPEARVLGAAKASLVQPPHDADAPADAALFMAFSPMTAPCRDSHSSVPTEPPRTAARTTAWLFSRPRPFGQAGSSGWDQDSSLRTGEAVPSQIHSRPGCGPRVQRGMRW